MARGLLAVVVLMGCGPMTGAEACQMLSESLCARLDECSGPRAGDSCRAEVRSGCCSGDGCSKEVPAPDAAIACARDYSAATCHDLTTGMGPTCWLGVVP